MDYHDSIMSVFSPIGQNSRLSTSSSKQPSLHTSTSANNVPTASIDIASNSAIVSTAKSTQISSSAINQTSCSTMNLLPSSAYANLEQTQSKSHPYPLNPFQQSSNSHFPPEEKESNKNYLENKENKLFSSQKSTTSTFPHVNTENHASQNNGKTATINHNHSIDNNHISTTYSTSTTDKFLSSSKSSYGLISTSLANSLELHPGLTKSEKNSTSSTAADIDLSTLHRLVPQISLQNQKKIDSLTSLQNQDINERLTDLSAKKISNIIQGHSSYTQQRSDTSITSNNNNNLASQSPLLSLSGPVPTSGQLPSAMISLVQTAVEESLSSLLNVLRQDLQNIHLDVLRQAHLQRINMEELINRSIPKHIQRLEEEIEKLKIENRRLKLKCNE